MKKPDTFTLTLIVLVIGAAILGSVVYMMNRENIRSQMATWKREPVAPISAETESLMRVIEKEQLATAQEIVSGALAQDCIREIDAPSTVIVGRRFWLLDYRQKTTLCVALATTRRRDGRNADFVLRDPMTNKQVGSYVMGRLSLH